MKSMELIVSLFNGIISLMAEYKVNYDSCKNLLEGIVNKHKGLEKNIQAIDNLCDDSKTIIIQIYKDFCSCGIEFTQDQKKVILGSLTKSIYSYVYYVEWELNKGLPLIERQGYKNKRVHACVLTTTCLGFLVGDVLKETLNNFKEDFKRYAEYTTVINQIYIEDSKNDEAVWIAIKARIRESKRIKEKYKVLKISESDLRSILEDDLLSNNRNIKKNTKLKVAV